MAKDYSRYLAKLDLPTGKTILITGGNSGIGFAVAKALLPYHWRILIATRNRQRGIDAKARLLSLDPKAKVQVYQLDVSSRISIAAFAKQIQEEKIDIDVFYANAGAYRIPFAKNEEGFEMTFATNYLGNLLLYDAFHDYLTNLGHPVKFILTSSITARFQRVKEDDLYGGKTYHKAKAYARSKVAVNMFYQTLAKNPDPLVLPLLVHPGVTYTPLIDKAFSNKTFLLWGHRFLRRFTHPVEKAALSTLYLLQNTITSPCFCGPRGPFHIAGYPNVYPLYQGNLKQAEEFVHRSQEILGIEA